MFKRMKKYGRCKDYVSYKSFEVYLSFILMGIFVLFCLCYLDIYENFKDYEPIINTILETVLSGAFGLLGMSLAGMAIIISIFTPETLSVIRKIDKNDTINRVLSQFEFSAFNLTIEIVYILFFQLCMASSKEVVDKSLFIIVFAIVIYHTFFNIFYILALIGNCIEINSIKDSCEVMIKLDKSKVDMVNEIRIDYILAIILKERGIKKEDFLKELFQMIDQSGLNEKADLKEYLQNYYK